MMSTMLEPGTLTYGHLEITELEGDSWLPTETYMVRMFPPIIPRVAFADAKQVNIYCHSCDSALFVLNIILESFEDSQMLDSVSGFRNITWRYRINNEYVDIRWIDPIGNNILGIKGDIAIIKSSDVCNPNDIDYITSKHPKGVAFF